MSSLGRTFARGIAEFVFQHLSIEVLSTMQQAGEIAVAQEPTSGRPATVVTLLPQAA